MTLSDGVRGGSLAGGIFVMIVRNREKTGEEPGETGEDCHEFIRDR